MGEQVSGAVRAQREAAVGGWLPALFLCIPVIGMLIACLTAFMLFCAIYTRSANRLKDYGILILGVLAYLAPIGFWMYLVSLNMLELWSTLALLALQILLMRYFLRKFDHLKDAN